jgi:hypothetical protein
MPENDKTEAAAGPEAAMAQAREMIRNGLRMASNMVHSRQTEMGYWPPEDGDQVDYRIFFAELYSKVGNAYETYKEERDPKHLIWIDPKTGEEVEPGRGVPQGLAIDLVEIVFDVLGFATNVGINIGHLAADVAVSMSGPVVEGEEEVAEVGEAGPDAGEGEGEGQGDTDEDFDLEALLQAGAEEPPPSVEIPNEGSGEKKPEGTTE